MIETVVNRHNELVDPHLEIWGWEIAAYLFLGGVVAGILVFAALLQRRREGEEDGPTSRWVRWLPFAGPVLLSAGMLLLLLDLEMKAHFYRFYLAFNPGSPMSWGAWILVLVYPASILLGLVSLTDAEMTRLKGWAPLRWTRLGHLVGWLRARWLSRRHTLQTVNIAAGVALGLYTGILLGTLQARALWNSALLAPLFLASGLSTGAALVMLLPVNRGEHRLLRRWDVAIIATEMGLLALFFIDRATSCALGGAQASRFLGGDLTAVFWSFVVVAGLLLPLLFEVLEHRLKLKPTLATPVLILVGGLLLRWILVFAGQTQVV